MSDPNNFSAFVQFHERSWGTVHYEGRPSLDQIMNAYIVCFWRMTSKRDPNFRITLHTSTDDLHKYAAQLILNLNVRLPDKRLAKMFVNHELYVIKGIRLLAGPAGKR